MNLIDLFFTVVRTALRLVVWAVAALLALSLVSVALVALLSWVLVSLALGRKPQVSLKGRFQGVRQFGSFGQASFKAGAFWPGQSRPAQDSSHPAADTPLTRRIVRPEAVVDVEARDVPAQRPGP